MTIKKRSIQIAGHSTSLSLEPEFWQALRDIATQRGTSIAKLVEEIDTKQEAGGLSGRIRVFILNHYRGTS
ncbi:ribbon-helix-helix domain-containing protein [Alphaproteobacteria bacterium]|jgi:predicted DNA-binding ribbon-helix-helix protein|nr:ribbon-helix-helix domain-containing protein [Alphaproteobacteria bacterium]